METAGHAAIAVADWDGSGQLDRLPELLVLAGLVAGVLTVISLATNGVVRTTTLLCKQLVVAVLMVYVGRWWVAMMLLGVDDTFGGSLSVLSLRHCCDHRGFPTPTHFGRDQNVRT